MSKKMTCKKGVACCGFQGKVHLRRCIAAFLVTGLAVYCLGRTYSSSPGSCPAAASVRIDLPLAEEPSPRNATKPAEAAASEIEHRILSDANLSQALARLNAGEDESELGLPADPAAAVALVRENLHVSVERTSRPGRLEVALVYTNNAPVRAARIANAIAEQFAEEYRTRIDAAARRRIGESREASEKARREYARARVQFDQFLESQFRDDQPLAESGALRPARSQVPPRQSPKIDNPGWIELNGQLRDARQRLASLQADRTPAHPEIRELQSRIDDLVRRLLAIPRQIINKEAVVALPGVALPEDDKTSPPRQQDAEKPPRNQPPSGRKHAEVAHAYRVQKAALDRDLEVVDRAIRKERAVCDRSGRAGNIRLAETAPSESAPTPSSHLIWMMLASAMTVAVGVAMMTAGMETDLPLRTADEARAKLSVPVIATIRGGRNQTVPAGRRSTRLEQVTWVALGVAMILACGGLVYCAM